MDTAAAPWRDADGRVLGGTTLPVIRDVAYHLNTPAPRPTGGAAPRPPAPDRVRPVTR